MRPLTRLIEGCHFSPENRLAKIALKSNPKATNMEPPGLHFSTFWTPVCSLVLQPFFWPVFGTLRSPEIFIFAWTSFNCWCQHLATNTNMTFKIHYFGTSFHRFLEPGAILKTVSKTLPNSVENWFPKWWVLWRITSPCFIKKWPWTPISLPSDPRPLKITINLEKCVPILEKNQ